MKYPATPLLFRAVVLMAALIAFLHSTVALAQTVSVGPPIVVRDYLRVGRTLQDIQRKTGVPAVAGAVINAGVIRYDAVGRRRADRPDAILDTDRFQLGSCTKAMTATLAAILVEQGKLRWNTTVSEVFPEFASEIDPALRNVTLQQLLAHRSGIASYFDGEILFSLLSYSGTPRQQRYAFARYILSQPPAYTVGSFQYSNADYGVAGAMLEQAAGVSWDSLMKTQLMVPLKAYITYSWPGYNDPNQPWGHLETDSGFLPLDANAIGDLAHLNADSDPSILYHYFLDMKAIAPAGDATMNPPDFARFVHLHLLGLMGRSPLLKPATIRTLHMAVGDNIGEDSGYALGWNETTIGGTAVSWHDGSADPFYAVMLIVPSKGIAAVGLANSGGPLGQAAAFNIVERLTGVRIIEKLGGTPLP